jgi:hypothetical protein
MCEDIFIYGELFGYGVGIDAPREVASGTCARALNPSGAMAMTKSKAKILLIFVLLDMFYLAFWDINHLITVVFLYDLVNALCRLVV